MPRVEAKRTFRYQARTTEDIRARANRRGGKDGIIKDKYKTYKVRDGKNLIRVLPATWEDANHYGFDLWVNYGIGVDNQSYLSLARMKGEADPLAEARRQAEKAGDTATAKALAPRERIAMWVIDRLAEDEGPQIWTAPSSFDKDLSAASHDEDTKKSLFIDNPEDGHDVRFYKEGIGLNTKYPGAKIRILDHSPVHQDPSIQYEWLEYIQQNPIPDCLQFYDYDHIATVFDGHVRSKDDDEESRRPSRDQDDERPAPRRRPVTDDDEEPPFEPSKPAPRRTAPRDEDDDEEAPVERIQPRRRADLEVDEEPEERPSRSRARFDDEPEEAPRRRPAVADDDEEAPPARQSIRDRLAARRRVAVEEEE